MRVLERSRTGFGVFEKLFLKRIKPSVGNQNPLKVLKVFQRSVQGENLSKSGKTLSDNAFAFLLVCCFCLGFVYGFVVYRPAVKVLPDGLLPLDRQQVEAAKR